MSLNALLNQSVVIQDASSTNYDKGGKRVLGSSTTYRARVQKTNKTIIGPDREQEPIDAIVFLPATASVSKGSKLTYNSEAYRVMAIEDVVVGNGTTHHLELKCQLWSYA